MSHDDFDDGLVHSHSWATEPPPAGMLPKAATTLPTEADGFDDGLVHSHGWARGAA